jgi:ABC-2 type transport system permease protein
MRAILIEHSFRPELMAQALVLNLAYFVAAAATFLWLMRKAREAGSLLQTGE